MTNFLVLAFLSAASYFLAQLLLPGCRLSLRPLLGPLNWFLALFFVLLVLVPIVVLIAGPSLAFLPSMPSDLAITLAVFLELLAFWSFAFSVHYFRRDSLRGQRSPSVPISNRWLPPIWLICLYGFLGLIGIALRFRSPMTLVYYFTDPQWYLLSADITKGINISSKTFVQAAPDFLIYFAPFSMIMLWCRNLSLEGKRPSVRSHLTQPFYIVLIAASASLYAYNRGSFTIPLIALFGVMMKRRRSFNIALIVLLAAAAFLTIKVSSYRENYATGGELVSQHPFTLDSWIQDYGQAPQYLGYFLQSLHYGDEPSMGRILYHSILSPVPIIGKAHRYYNGIYLYGTALGRFDHPPLFLAELYGDFSFFGVMAGFIVLGSLVALFQDRFEASTEPFESFALLFAAICLGYAILLCAEVVVQLAIYQCAPIACFLLYLRAMRSRFGKGFTTVPAVPANALHPSIQPPGNLRKGPLRI